MICLQDKSCKHSGFMNGKGVVLYMNHKHLLVFTGGTISSVQKDNEIICNQKTFELLNDCHLSDFDILEPADILSENMTPQLIFQIYKKIIEKLKEKNYRSMIITHGTDTMAYTAQLGALLFSQLPFPVVFLGSKLPAGHPNMDGKINFKHACKFVEQVDSGVFVISRQQDGNDVVFAAESIQQADFIGDDFSAFQNNIFGWFEKEILIRNTSFQPYSQINQKNFQNTNAKEFIQLFTNSSSDLQPSQMRPISFSYPFQYIPLPFQRLFKKEINKDKPGIFLVSAYVGQDYSLFDLEKYSGNYILHQMYHSGTACMYGESNQQLSSFAERCKKNGKHLFIAPLYRNRTPYETTAALLKEHVIPLYDMPVERAWAILTLASWLDDFD